VDWARRLEQVERIKAKERQATSTGGINPQLRQNSAQAEKCKTADIVAKESGFGSKDTYRKAKFIADNAYKETIKKLNNSKITILTET